MNLCYLEYTHDNKIVDAETKKEITSNLIGFSLGFLKEDTKLSEKQIIDLMNLYKKYYYEY